MRTGTSLREIVPNLAGSGVHVLPGVALARITLAGSSGDTADEPVGAAGWFCAALACAPPVTAAAAHIVTAQAMSGTAADRTRKTSRDDSPRTTSHPDDRHGRIGPVPLRLLFVCSGNICRSPAAEAVMRRLVEEAGLADEIEVDSAGTGAWHVGEPPDPRAAAAARGRGLSLGGIARQIGPSDFDEFDLILAVDDENLRRLSRLAPPGASGRVRKLASDDVPDPYYGGADGFEHVLDLLEKDCRALLDELRQD
jgi:protein-tyrosine phosphatase